MNLMLRRCQGGWLRLGASVYAGLALVNCTDPKFRDPDASEMHGDLSDAAQHSMLDAAGSDAGHPASDAGGLHDAGGESLEARMQSMVGKYFMRLYFNTRDGTAKPIVKGFSTVEISMGASGLEMEEQPCHYWGTAKLQLLFDAIATTEFDASKTPRNVYQLEYNGKNFDSSQAGNVTLGYDALPPAGCDSAKSLPTTVEQKPWLSGANCSCPSDRTQLPETKEYSDCRINDDDQDGSPGVTMIGQVQGYDPVDMYLVQRSRDQYFNLDYKNAQQNKVLLGTFYTTRLASLLGCPPPDANGPNCIIVNAPACPKEYNTVELVRLSAEQVFSCQGLYEADALTGVFNEPPPANCEP